MMMRISVSFIVLALQYTSISSQGDNLVQPPIIDSSASGILDVTLSIEYADITGPGYTIENARLLNGTIPGTTLRVNPGDTMRILYQNKLSHQDGAVNDNVVVGGGSTISTNNNRYHNPDHSNLHFHGAHVTGELPSDDARMSIGPNESFQYETVFPTNHLPGTHWMHPHAHGSSALQVGGGAALALIVKDPENFVPAQVADAPDVLLFVQDLDRSELQDVIRDIRDGMTKLLGFSSNGGRFRLVNGQYRPTVSLVSGEWQRWRVVHAGWLRELLDLRFASSRSSCEMHLLAKDGVYIRDYPRSLTVLPIPSGGRADVMVRCSAVGIHNMLDFQGHVILTVSVEESDNPTTSSSELEPWAPDYPAYLNDLRSTAPTQGCSCSTNLNRCGGNGIFCLNNQLYNPDVYMHTVQFGSVVQRSLGNFRRHPYHQHVYPFQLVGGVDNLSDGAENRYFQRGDWHDVFQAETNNNVIVRYRPDVHDGTIMMHCHILTHQDLGTMAQELVVNGVGDDGTMTCRCNALYRSPWTRSPTDQPTISPTTAAPSVGPTQPPTSTPSVAPTSVPSSNPTVRPSETTTTLPTLSLAPTHSPSTSFQPTVTQAPSFSPTFLPSTSPSSTLSPSSFPTFSSSIPPSSSLFPSSFPTFLPSIPPSSSLYPTTTPPTNSPTSSPSITVLPSGSPSTTMSPTSTISPSMAPTTNTTLVPTDSYGLPGCTATRGNLGRRRVFVPYTMMKERQQGDSSTNQEYKQQQAWSQALCCVYTHVKVLESSEAPRGRMVSYDGTSYRVPANSFSELASVFYNDICNGVVGPRGREDCTNQSNCVQAALTGLV